MMNKNEQENSAIKLLDIDFKSLSEDELKFLFTKLDSISNIMKVKAVHESYSLYMKLILTSLVIVAVFSYIAQLPQIIIFMMLFCSDFYFLVLTLQEHTSIKKKLDSENSELKKFINTYLTDKKK